MLAPLYEFIYKEGMNNPFSTPENDKTYRMPGDLSRFDAWKLERVAAKMKRLHVGETEAQRSTGPVNATMQSAPGWRKLVVNQNLADLRLLRITSVELTYSEWTTPLIIARQAIEYTPNGEPAQSESVYRSDALPENNKLGLSSVVHTLWVASHLGPVAVERS